MGTHKIFNVVDPKKILAKRMAAEFNFKVSLFIDEAHRYLPQNEFDMSENGFFSYCVKVENMESA